MGPGAGCRPVCEIMSGQDRTSDEHQRGNMSERYDVIVVGLGGMGSSAAYALARRGRRVLGIEQFTPAHALGSSHGATRVVRKAYFEKPDYVPLLVRSYQLWDELSAAAGSQLFTRCGALMMGPPDSAVVVRHPGVGAALVAAARGTRPGRACAPGTRSSSCPPTSWPSSRPTPATRCRRRPSPPTWNWPLPPAPSCGSPRPSSSWSWAGTGCTWWPAARSCTPTGWCSPPAPGPAGWASWTASRSRCSARPCTGSGR